MNPNRLVALDQFRGYTVVGMLVVNFVGGYANVPGTLSHHHTYCSYADTIMPQFLFAVGMAMRMTYLKRIDKDAPATTYRKFIVRGLGLMLLGCVVYKLTGKFEKWEQIEQADWADFFGKLFKRGPFETLTHIGLTTLICLPVIGRGPGFRTIYLVAMAAWHLGLSWVWYYGWNMTDPRGIDGGPLGCFSWAIPLLAGSLAFDALGRLQPWHFAVVGLIVAGVAIALMTMMNPTTRFPFSTFARQSPESLNLWTMSQRAGSVTYTLFGSGVAIVVFAAFRTWESQFTVPLFDLFGRHALAAYLIHDMVAGMVKPFVPKDAPGWWVWGGFAIYIAVTWLFVRFLDRQKLVLKL
jgi:predicted acyltransferase